MAFPAPRESQGMNEGKMRWLGPQRQKLFGSSTISAPHWPKGLRADTGPFPFPAMWVGGPEPFQVLFRPFHRAHLSPCQHRFPKFTWGPVYFSFFF